LELRNISNDLLRKFKDLVKNLDFNVSNYLVFNELTKEQQTIIDNATSILKENTVDEIKIFGGNIEKNLAPLEKLKENIKIELEKPEYEELKSDLEKIIPSYIKNFEILISKICGAIIPVKQMPFIEVFFRTIPRIIIDNENPLKMSIDDRTISYYGEIKCIIPRLTLFGKIKNADPLFAPLIGDLDLNNFKLEESEQKGRMIENFSYISALISSMDKNTTKNNILRYHEQYQRHGEPICDFLLKDIELMEAMKKLASAIESKRTTNVSVCAIAIPNNQTRSTIVIVQDESKLSNAYVTCFEALLRFSAVCYEAPSTKKPSEIDATLAPSVQQGQITGTGSQKLEVWTSEELAKDAVERGLRTGLPPNMEEWTEEQLQKYEKSRTDIGVNLPVWSEEELEELGKQRQSGLTIPEWEETGLPECPKCGYTIREGWDVCPICNHKIGEPVTEEKQEQEPSKDSKEKKKNQDGIDDNLNEERENSNQNSI
jgi:hypothetical protein